MEIDITIVTRITIPDGSVVNVAPSGETNGFRLPGGELVRPWVAYEVEDDADVDPRDIDRLEMAALGIQDECDIRREIAEA